MWSSNNDNFFFSFHFQSFKEWQNEKGQGDECTNKQSSQSLFFAHTVWMDEWMNEWTNERTNEGVKNLTSFL